MFNFFRKTPKISAKDFIEIKDEIEVLDVRGPKEVSKEEREFFPNYTLIPVTELKDEVDTLDKDKTYYVLCRSGQRSTVASGILSENNIANIVVVGGMMQVNKEIK